VASPMPVAGRPQPVAQPFQQPAPVAPPPLMFQSQRRPVDVVTTPSPMPSASVPQTPVAQQSLMPPVAAPAPKEVSQEMAEALQASKMPSEHLSVRGQDDKSGEVSIKLH